jgi:hypothetical protein
LEDVPEVHTSQMGEDNGSLGAVTDGGLKKRR